MIQDLGKGKYRFVVNIGSGQNRRRLSKTVECKGKKEAKKLYAEFEAECQQDPLTDITVKQLIEDYIDHCKALGRKATTIRGYEIAVERIYSSVDKILAKDCTTYRLEKIVAQMSENGLGAKSIKNTMMVVSAAYRHAIKTGQLSDNPCERLTLPKITPREIRILHKDEIPDFVFAIQDEPLDDRVAYELALFMGLRRSEILGLRESDVDIVNGILNIHNTRHRVDGEDIESDTKTKRSTRTLAMPDIVLIDAAKLMQMHREFKYESTDFLIQDGFGNAINPQALASRLTRMEERKGLPHVSLQGLRHTYASMLNESGVDMARISAELGHSNLSTTMNVYTHIFKTPTQSSRGIASTIDQITGNSAKLLPNSENEKPSKR